MESKAMKNYASSVADIPDKDLRYLAFYDAGITCPDVNEFNILADIIVEELVKRGLRTDRVFQIRDEINKILQNHREPVEALKRRRASLSMPAPQNASNGLNKAHALSMELNSFERNETNESTDENELPQFEIPDIPLPKGYSLSQTGVLGLVDLVGKFCPVYYKPIYIKELLINKNTGEERLRIAFYTDDAEKTMVLFPEEVYNGQGLKRLSNYGAVIDSREVGLLENFFKATMRELRSSIKRQYVTDRLGWVNDDDWTEFVPYTSSIVYDESANYQKEFSCLLKSRGTVEEWVNLIGKYRDEQHVPFRIAIAASFASVLLKPLNPQPFIVHLWGPSGTGKSVTLQAVASVWATPEIAGNGYIKPMSGSLAALETQAQFYGNLPYCLDDSENTASTGSGLKAIVYNLVEGMSKPRANSTGGMRDQNGWCNIVMTNGESPMVSSDEGGGASHRILDVHVEKPIIESDKAGMTDFCRELNRLYGTAGRKFIEQLTQDGAVDEAKELFDRYQQEIQEHAAGRQTAAAALILTADQLIAKWIFNDERVLTVEDILPYLKTEEDIDRAAKLHQKIYEWIGANSNRFNPESATNRYGQKIKPRSGNYRNKAVYAFIPIMLERLLGQKDIDGDIDAYVSWAKKNGKLITDKNGYKTVNVALKNIDRDENGKIIPTKQMKCYVLVFDEETETATETDQSNEEETVKAAAEAKETNEST